MRSRLLELEVTGVTSSSADKDMQPLVLLAEDEDSGGARSDCSSPAEAIAYAPSPPWRSQSPIRDAAAVLVADYRLDGDGIALLAGPRGRGWQARF